VWFGGKDQAREVWSLVPDRQRSRVAKALGDDWLATEGVFEQPAPFRGDRQHQATAGQELVRDRRDDPERVQRAGYSAEREYSGSALGAHALAGLRLRLIGPTWTELDVSGSWHAARSEGQLVSRWRGGGSLSVGASF
jgi:hypothetical protein